MKFSNAYSPAPNCSPTRMSIQTGKTAARLGATDIIDVVPDENGRANIQVFHDTMYHNKPMIVPLPISDIPGGARRPSRSCSSSTTPPTQPAISASGTWAGAHRSATATMRITV